MTTSPNQPGHDKTSRLSNRFHRVQQRNVATTLERPETPG